jgi:cobalt/nickel transport system permease protein
MHIPDGFLDPKVSMGMMGVAVAVFSYSLAKMKEVVTALQPVTALAAAGKSVGSMAGGMRRILTKDGERTIYKLVMVVVLVFVVQMFDFTVINGTTGHIMGGMLAALILGPFVGAIAMSIVLITQAFFLADGGVLALGANIVSMVLFGTIIPFYLYSFCKKIIPEWAAILFAGWLSLPLAALACALEISLSGQAPISVIVPAMLKVHLLIGVAEALFTFSLLKIYRLIINEQELMGTILEDSNI